jgi:hypothetical protein
LTLESLALTTTVEAVPTDTAGIITEPAANRTSRVSCLFIVLMMGFGTIAVFGGITSSANSELECMPVDTGRDDGLLDEDCEAHSADEDECIEKGRECGGELLCDDVLCLGEGRS